MKNKKIIYSSLEQLLFDLGFRILETQNKKYRVYEHSNDDALIIFPNYQPEDMVDSAHWMMIRRTLREYDLMDEKAFEKWFEQESRKDQLMEKKTTSSTP
jgi:hypothetical protein